MNIDVNELRARVLGVHNGTLPPDAVSDDELRAAAQLLREQRRTRAQTPGGSRRSAAPSVTLDGGTPGGLLDLLSRD